MPGWHDATKQFQDAGKVRMVGIIQEQNPDRARLFMQWKQMGWPILVDTFNLLEVSVVPLTYAIDKHGIVRMAGLRLKDAPHLETEFLQKIWEVPSGNLAEAAENPENGSRREETLTGAALGDENLLRRAIETYSARALKAPEDGWGHFRLAASYRLRYDSAHRRPQDFQKAIDHWQRALDLDPDNYIWRRRIQQYGPRLHKPYPFYDWVATAQQEIRARGESPGVLLAALTSSELAEPRPKSSEDEASARPIAGAAQQEPEHPDPAGRVRRDSADDAEKRLIHIESTLVPRRLSPGATTRAHLTLQPNEAVLAHWNNESEPLRVWLDLPPGWTSSQRLLEHKPSSTAPTSHEARRLEFDLTAPKNLSKNSPAPKAYAFYYVCEDENGTCLYRRQDVSLAVELE